MGLHHSFLHNMQTSLGRYTKFSIEVSSHYIVCLLKIVTNRGSPRSWSATFPHLPSPNGRRRICWLLWSGSSWCAFSCLMFRILGFNKRVASEILMFRAKIRFISWNSGRGR